MMRALDVIKYTPALHKKDGKRTAKHWGILLSQRGTSLKRYSHLSAPMINSKVKIVHHHCFKCAGSTVMGILERNYPGNVLYLEGANPGQRFGCEEVLPFLEKRPYEAISSHVMMIPDVGRNIGTIHFTLLRDPVDRVLSSYRFQKRRGYIPRDIDIEEYIETNFQANNFQAKHTSIQEMNNGDDGWEISDRIFAKIEANEIFVGLVEYFNLSMLLLEKLLHNQGVSFDAAYSGELNKTPQKKWVADDTSRIRQMIAAKNPADIALYEAVEKRLFSQFHADISHQDQERFSKRCAALRRWRWLQWRQVPPESKWLHVEKQ